MANEVLNQVLAAEQARRPGCLVRSIAWGPWQGGMVTPLIAERFRRRGVALIDPQDGARAFLAELGADGAHPEVILSAGLMSQEAGTVAGQLTVAAPEYAYLADHQVGGVPVVPVASVLDWFARAARAWRPEAGALVLRDLQVLSKITLPRLSGGGHQLVLRGRETAGRDGPVLRLDLYGDGDRHGDWPKYRASASLAPPPRPGPWDTPTGLAPFPQPYDGVTLFHGPRFHALRAAAPGISAAGAEGTVAGMRALGWPGSACRMDPAAIDGALQLAVLWAQRAGAGATLPMAVRECRLYRDGAIDDTARCVVRARQAGKTGAECDVALIDPDGTIRIELLGVQLVRAGPAELAWRGSRSRSSGAAACCPARCDPDAFWENIAAGRASLSPVPAGRWRLPGARPSQQDPDGAGWAEVGGYVHGLDEVFDPDGFSVGAAEIMRLDPLYRWVLHAGRQALREIGLPAGMEAGLAGRAGLVLGNLCYPSAALTRLAEHVWRDGRPAAGTDVRDRFCSGLPAHFAARALGLGAGGFALDAACASSLYAIKLGCDRLHDGTADLMLAGAVTAPDDLLIHGGFRALAALSRTGRSRPIPPGRRRAGAGRGSRPDGAHAAR